MLLRFLSFRAPVLFSGSCFLHPSLSFCNSSPKPTYYAPNWSKSSNRMGEEDYAILKERKRASVRLCNVSSFTTEILELRAENPSLQVLFIPGNPGVVQFYTEFVEAVYEMLGGCASITVVGHISQTRKDWERGKLFSLQDQVDHKVAFIKQELQDTEIPLLLVGHSIGSYISLEIFKRLPDQVKYCIGLYPFLSLNKDSSKQIGIGKLAASPILCTLLSSIVAVLGLLPTRASSFLVRRSVGKSWTTTAVEALCSHLLQYHTMRNILFMAMSEFEKLAEAPDWKFMTGKQDQLAFLFGIDDHWGPLSMFEEISKQVENVSLSIEKEGHTHAFSCTEAGSVWVADHVVGLIKHQFQAKDGKVSLKTRKMISYAEVIKPKPRNHVYIYAAMQARVIDPCALRRCRIVNKAASSLKMCFGDYPAEGIYVDDSYFDDEHIFS